MRASHVHYTTSGDELRARRAAGRAARRIEDGIAPYTTPGLEAAVVRLLGAVGTDETGVPQARQFVERLHRWGVLGTGGAHWLAGAMVRLRADARTSVAWVLTEDLKPPDLAVPAEVAPEVLKHAVRGARRTLEACWRARDDRLATLIVGPDQRLIEVLLGDDAALRDAVRGTVDLVVMICPEDALPAEPALQHAHLVVNQASERAGRYIRLGVRGPTSSIAYLGTLAALTGLDAIVTEPLDDVETHFARRICAQAGVMVLGVGTGRDDDLDTELAQMLVTEQLAALAGLPSTSWGWVPGHPIYRDALATCFPFAFIARQHKPRAGQGPCLWQGGILSYADALQQAIAYLEAWPPPALEPATLVKKDVGYWNPFT